MRLQQSGFPGFDFSGFGYPPSASTPGLADGGAWQPARASGSPSGGLQGIAPASSLSEFAAVRESETLTIQTTDGAQVTIRLRAQATEAGASQTQADGSTSSADALFASSKFQVQVSGNLSSADMTAINNIVSQVDSLATQFFSGDVQDAFAAAASIGADPSEIAGFSLQMSYSATLYQQVGAAADPTNAATPAVTSPTTTDEAGATNTTATPQQTIANFLQNALAKLSGPANGSSTTLSARWGIQLLAVALPVYAQSQSGTGSQAVADAQSASPASGTGNTSPAVTQVTITARPQAAHLAAATLIQLVN